MLRETETIQPKPQIVVVDQHPVVSNNDTTSTQTSSNTTTTNTDSTTSTQNTTTSTNTTNTTTSVFTAYDYKYIGNDILTQYSTNQALKLSYNLVQSDQYWNHTVTMIVQTGKVPTVI